MRMMRILTLVWVLIFLSSGCGFGGRPRAYISEHYYGWVRIEYGVAGAPPLDIDRSWSFHSGSPYFSESGLLQTSSQLNQEGAEIYFGTAMEIRPVPPNMLHGQVSSLNIPKSDGSHFAPAFEIAFIGPSDVYEKHRNELERFKRSNGQYVISSMQDLPRLRNLY